jgi:hypothetical protein
LRADGSNNHHNLLLLNARAPFGGMDGQARFHHANFGVEDVDEIMVGANYMTRRGWEPSHLGLGRHRIDSALFYYLPCPAGGEAEYGADADYVDDGWVPRDWIEPLFAFSHFVHNLPDFLANAPDWRFAYMTGESESKETGGSTASALSSPTIRCAPWIEWAWPTPASNAARRFPAGEYSMPRADSLWKRLRRISPRPACRPSTASRDRCFTKSSSRRC